MAVILAAVSIWMIPRVVDACMGTPAQPVCSKSTWLAKFAGGVFVGPGVANIGTRVRIVIRQNPPGQPACTPVSTKITLTLTCLPPPGGAPPMGMVIIPTPAPGLYGAVVPVGIPFAGPRVCNVMGTAVTTYADGSTTTAIGDTEVCIVEPAPGMPGVPRLDMQLVTPAFQAAHPGDQREHVIRLTNNDPTNSVSLMFSADSAQTSRLATFGPPPPPGAGVGTFAISDPGAGDNFPIAFDDSLYKVGPGPNQYSLDDNSSEGGVGLPAGGGLMWINQYTSTASARFIDRISVALGSVPNGLPISVLLYDDPTSDGNPNDAVLLERAEATTIGGGTGTFIDVPIRSTDAGPPGHKFFVAVVMQQQPAASFRAAIDTTSNAGRSWIVANSACRVNVANLAANTTPPMTTAAVGIPGNWFIRAHGTPRLTRINCLPMPPDPPAFPVPTITRTLLLCPGESKLVRVATRSWAMCADGSCSEQRFRVTGTFADTSPAMACVGAALHADTAVSPDYLCQDSGMMATVTPQLPAGLSFFSQMPTHNVREGVHLDNMQIATGFPVVGNNPPAMIWDNNQGRETVAVQGAGGPATVVGQPVHVEGLVYIFSKQPLITTEIIGLSLHGASPAVPPALQNSYFSINARSRLSGPGIPPTLDSFFDVFYNVSLDGISGGLHRPGRIIPNSVNFTIVDPTHMSVAFQAVFQNEIGLPNTIDQVRVHFDIGGSATGLIPPPTPLPCAADVFPPPNGNGTVNIDDLVEVITHWGPCLPPCPPYCRGDIDHNCRVDIDDLVQLITTWGGCP